MNYRFQWAAPLRSLPDMLAGALVTLETSLLAVVMGIAIAVLLALCSRSGNGLLKSVAAVWVSIARNTPALFQIYMVYFGLGSLGIQLDSYPSLIIGITFNNAGYLTEAFRGGLGAVPETQVRAARSLGMGPSTVFSTIVMPQVFRVVFYPITNQMIWSILMTSLGVVVGMTDDLMGVTQQLNVLTFRTFEFFSIAAVIYYLLAKGVAVSARLLAYRLFRY